VWRVDESIPRREDRSNGFERCWRGEDAALDDAVSGGSIGGSAEMDSSSDEKYMSAACAAWSRRALRMRAALAEDLECEWVRGGGDWGSGSCLGGFCC
jgi:hypothetical protein